jgi:TolA-binding protein
MKGTSSLSKLMLLLGIVLFFTLPFLASNAAGDILSDRQQIESLIETGNLTEAQTKIEQLKATYSQDPQLPEVLYWIAEKYRWSGKYDQARDLHQQIIQNFSGSPYADRAQLAYSRIEVLSLIDFNNLEQAEEALDKLIADFQDHQDLSETLYWVGREFGWHNRFEKEKGLYQKIAKDHPSSQFAARAQLDFSRAQVMSLIIFEEYDSAQEAYVGLVKDFSKHPDLPESLYRIGKIWVWSGNNCTAANAIYQKIIQDYPGSIYAQKSQTFLQITQRSIDTFALIESGQEQAAQGAINQLVTDFDGNELLPHMVFLCGEHYFEMACKDRDEGLEKEAAEDFARAIKAWKKIAIELPASGATPEGYYHLALAYRQIGEYALAIENYTKVVEDYPDYRFTWDAQFRIGNTYEKMVDAGLLSESAAKPLIASAYQKVLDKYPHCKAAKAAQTWLSRN